MQLYFVRHAQSTNNALWDETGASIGRSEDPELTEMGLIQAGLAAKYIRESRDESLARFAQTGKPTEFNITHLYTSPMIRAVATAAEISKQNAPYPRNSQGNESGDRMPFASRCLCSSSPARGCDWPDA